MNKNDTFRCFDGDSNDNNKNSSQMIPWVSTAEQPQEAAGACPYLSIHSSVLN